MTQRPRLLFDENFGRPAVDRLCEFLRIDNEDENSPEVRHIFDFQESGALDEEWIPKMAQEQWVILTADRGKKPSKGGKLPRLCSEFGVTHVLMTGTVHQRSLHEKIQTIVHVWGDLIRLYLEPPGSRFQLEAALIPPNIAPNSNSRAAGGPGS